MTVENKTLKVGDEIRFGMQLMIVDEITEFNTIIAIDEDGQDFELTENEIDVFGSQGTQVLTYPESMER
jgi:hypothetical protein